MILKNIVVYYLTIIAPFALLIMGSKMHFLSSGQFVLGLLIWALVWHPAMTGIRLLALGLIRKAEFPRTFIPFWNSKFTRSIFLKG